MLPILLVVENKDSERRVAGREVLHVHRGADHRAGQLQPLGDVALHLRAQHQLGLQPAHTGQGLVGIGGFADDLLKGPSMAWLIENGFLSRYRIFAPPTALDMTGVRTRAGDYAKDDLSQAMDKPVITGSALEHYQRLASGRRAVAFCVSVQHAEHVAAEFNAADASQEKIMHAIVNHGE